MRRFSTLLSVAGVAWVFLGAAPVHADVAGQTYDVRVNPSYDAAGAQHISTTLRAVSQRAYVYVDDRYWASLMSDGRTRFLAEVQAVASQFDSVIHPRSVALWGNEATPGVDGDSHVVIVLERLKSGSGGYFETIHNYSKERAPEGNAREMIFINAESVLGGTARSFIAHEFQHLISFNQRELSGLNADDVWLNEGRSEYNGTNVGYSDVFDGSALQRRVQTFLRNPSDSLTDWPNTSTDYAIASLFVHYLVDQFGSSILASSEHTAAAGAAALSEWLTMHSGPSFERVFANWMVASFLNERTESTAYGYVRSGLSDFHVLPPQSTRLNVSNRAVAFSETLHEWQPFWVQADIDSFDASSLNAHVRIDGDPGVQWHGAVIASYGAAAHRVIPFDSGSGSTVADVPLQQSGVALNSVVVAVTHGGVEPVAGRSIASHAVIVNIATDSNDGAPTASSVVTPSTTLPINGDLIRRRGQPDVYVVWGAYRRYLTSGILELYGFQNRPVTEVPDDVFFSYKASVYVRAQTAQQVYAVWPDSTKHWLHITAAQWDASFRDWGAIFTVNDAEIAHYTQGSDIVR